jgi:hypothetical protein
MNLFHWFIQGFRQSPAAFNRTKKKADRLHKKNGCRYRVFFILGRYRVMDRNTIRNHKKSGLFKFWLKAGSDFDKVALYDTNPPIVKSV